MFELEVLGMFVAISVFVPIIPISMYAVLVGKKKMQTDWQQMGI